MNQVLEHPIIVKNVLVYTDSPPIIQIPRRSSTWEPTFTRSTNRETNIGDFQDTISKFIENLFKKYKLVFDPRMDRLVSDYVRNPNRENKANVYKRLLEVCTDINKRKTEEKEIERLQLIAEVRQADTRIRRAKRLALMKIEASEEKDKSDSEIDELELEKERKDERLERHQYLLIQRKKELEQVHKALARETDEYPVRIRNGLRANRLPRIITRRKIIIDAKLEKKKELMTAEKIKTNEMEERDRIRRAVEEKQKNRLKVMRENLDAQQELEIMQRKQKIEEMTLLQLIGPIMTRRNELPGLLKTTDTLQQLTHDIHKNEYLGVNLLLMGSLQYFK